jgi:hypothetical protein
MKKILIFFALILLVTQTSAVYVPPPQETLVWKSQPLDLPNSTPLLEGQYYLVDSFLYVYSGELYCKAVFIGYNGEINYVGVPLYNYYMKRIPKMGTKYIKNDGFLGSGDFVEITT